MVGTVAELWSEVPATEISTLTPRSLVALPEIDWVVDGWIAQAGYSVLYGAPGEGKTFLLLQLALCVATGRPWLGNEVRQGGVVFVAAEGFAGLGRRFTAAVQAAGLTNAQFRQLPIALTDDTVDLGFLPDLAGLADAASALPGGCRLIIVDPIADAMSGDENGEAMQTLASGVRALAGATGAAVVLGHHTNGDGTAERGNKRLRARAVAMLRLSRTATGSRRLIANKQRHGVELELELILREVGSSLVPEAVPGSTVPRQAPREAPSARSERAERALLSALAGSSEALPQSILIRAAKGNGAGDAALRRSLQQLVDEGTVSEIQSGNRRLYALVAH